MTKREYIYYICIPMSTKCICHGCQEEALDNSRYCVFHKENKI